MDEFLYFIRDNLVGTHYFIYSFTLLFFMFALIGYLLKQKYGRLDVILSTNKEVTVSKINEEKKKIIIPKEDMSMIMVQTEAIKNIPDVLESNKPDLTNNVEVQTTKVTEKETGTNNSLKSDDNLEKVIEVEPIKKDLEPDLVGKIPDIKV